MAVFAEATSAGSANTGKTAGADRVIALAGNPNVGKSTIFNSLTGLCQHTGNWPGKTVTTARGYCRYKSREYVMVDLPGCYSLAAHSAEEETARDFICFGKPDSVVVVCDATCLERNLNLVLQTLEITRDVIVCVNLIDEAKKKKISVDSKKLSELLGVPVVETAARSKKGLDALMDIVNTPADSATASFKIDYPGYIEAAVSELAPVTEKISGGRVNARWLALKLLENDKTLMPSIGQRLNIELEKNEEIVRLLQNIRKGWDISGITEQKVKDDIVRALVKTAEGISRDSIAYHDEMYDKKDRKLDRILTGKLTGFPIMLASLTFIFWITLSGANYPSQLISKGLFWAEARLLDFFVLIGAPQFLYEMLILGAYRVLAWVISVMLPPMAIFFPLFTLIEDLGYLPRIAFNLDKAFKKCCACGKQALTMCMGLTILLQAPRY